MDACEFREQKEDIEKIHKSFGIYQIAIDTFGQPVEMIQGFLIYIGEDGTIQSSIRPTSSRDSNYTLKMNFKIKPFSVLDERYKRSQKYELAKPYDVPVKLKIIDYFKEPYSVDFAEKPRCKTVQDDMLWLADKDEPSHQEIAIRFWLENRLQRYTFGQKQLKKLKHFYKKERMYVQSPRTPWYVRDSINEDIIIAYKELRNQHKKRKIGARDVARGVCEAFENQYK